MTSEVGFVRNNPFIQNDLGIRKTCRVVPSASTLGISAGGGINWQCRKTNNVSQSASFTNIESVTKPNQDRPLIVLQHLASNKNVDEAAENGIF
ncbi:hypothetical protein QR680_017651 [Steinernema hermaphroditum]|uniref:Uncharacterized protein n=1 Tax=Steinernema hermaphroditum TaxID=289476 RepID=A0AA39HFC2_9BILA|nr:hypothetical protein QR680_017651 [Steinernema hermaphroditum]